MIVRRLLPCALVVCAALPPPVTASESPSDTIFAAAWNGSKLATVGQVQVEADGVADGRQSFAKQASRRLWKLRSGDAIAFIFPAPGKRVELLVEVTQLGWLDGDHGRRLQVELNGRRVGVVSTPPPGKLAVATANIAVASLKSGSNELVLANNDSGTVGVQGVRVLVGKAAAPAERPAANNPPARQPAPKPDDQSSSAATVKLSAADKQRGLTPLHAAARAGDVDAVRALLDKGADKAATTRDKWTALHFAAGGGHLDAVKLLVEAGVPVDARTGSRSGWAAPIYLAAKQGYATVVTFLATHGADVNRAAIQDWTPLHIAAAGGKEAVVLALLGHGAKANVMSDQRQTPLHLAAARGYTGICQALVEKGKADVNAPDGLKATALHRAAEGGHLETVQFLVKSGAAINALDGEGRTPVDLCNPDFVVKWRHVKDPKRHEAVYDWLRARKGRHGWELKKGRK